MLDEALAQRARELASGPKPLLIATDLDGTLAPIVPDPADARVPDETLAILAQLTAHANVAVVTGRDLHTARLLVPVSGVVFVASHGLEASFDSNLLPQVELPTLSRQLDLLAAAVGRRFTDTGLRIERKSVSVAFHYRADPALLTPLQEALAELPPGLDLQAGKMVLEAVPRGAGKDAALAALVARFAPRSLLVLGDDLTDIAMFRAAERLRPAGANILIAGVAGGAEAPAEIAALADALLASPAEAGHFLAAVASSLARADSASP